jgi:SHS family sialic acid transporter-like MFS transporter
MTPAPTSSASSASGAGKWMALTAALLGWMFDGAEMGLFSMVGRDAIKDLMTVPNQGPPIDSVIDFYFGVVLALFLVGAATGGVLFGWLGDRLGRVRAMSLSVITYAVFTGLCGIVNSPLQIAILRFIAALGMGGEWALGVALVMEVWPNRSRALMAGLIGAAANVGYLLVGIIGIWLAATLHIFERVLTDIGLADSTVKSLIANKGWRIMMILGTTPAFLTFFFRLYVPESDKWEREQTKGTTSNWATLDLFGVLIGAMGPALIISIWAYDPADWSAAMKITMRVTGSILGIVIAAFGYIYPVRRFLHRVAEQNPAIADQSGKIIRRMLLAAALSGVALMGTWGATQWAAAWAGKMTAGMEGVKNPREWTQICLAVGAVIGTIGAALMGDWLGRRVTYFLMCVASLATGLALYQFNTAYNTQFLVCAFLAGVCTASFYGWLPLYLPELFSTQVRATGQGFSFNFGRIIAAVGALQAGALFRSFSTELHFAGLTLRPGHPGACSIICFIYVVGMVLIWFAPETKGQPLPD